MPKVKATEKKAPGKKPTTKRPKKRATRDASGGEDKKSARKYRRGSRVEAYTWGEVSGKKGSNWPF